MEIPSALLIMRGIQLLITGFSQDASNNVELWNIICCEPEEVVQQTGASWCFCDAIVDMINYAFVTRSIYRVKYDDIRLANLYLLL